MEGILATIVLQYIAIYGIYMIYTYFYTVYSSIYHNYMYCMTAVHIPNTYIRIFSLLYTKKILHPIVKNYIQKINIINTYDDDLYLLDCGQHHTKNILNH